MKLKNLLYNDRKNPYFKIGANYIAIGIRQIILGVPSFVGRALGLIPCFAAGMPPRSLTRIKG
jgi:hypothetical protein